jgi:hypothetical protein
VNIHAALRQVARSIRDNFTDDDQISVWVHCSAEGPVLYWEGPYLDADDTTGERDWETRSVPVDDASPTLITGHVVPWLRAHGVLTGSDEEIAHGLVLGIDPPAADPWSCPDFPRSAWKPLPDDDRP